MISSQDQAAIATLSANLDQSVAALANQILGSIRPERAALLRLQGDLVSRSNEARGRIK
jgi:hypothetical protein